MLNSKTMLEIYGKKGSLYDSLSNNVKAKIEEIKSKQPRTFEIAMREWENHFSSFYKMQSKDEIFLKHVYLLLISKNVVTSYLSKILPNLHYESLCKEINEQCFQIPYFIDLIQIIGESKDIQSLFAIPDEIPENGVQEDIFIDLYHEIIQQENRLQMGEFHTPSKFSNFLTGKLMDEILQTKDQNFIDPSCGTGSFLVALIKRYVNDGADLDSIVQSIHGFEINPISANLASINYILAIPLDLLKSNLANLRIPIQVGDAMKDQLDIEYDVIIGNPPWIVMRNIVDQSYREFLKGLTIKYDLLDANEVHLFTQLEMAAIFYSRTVDTFLRDGGIVCDIMPHSFLRGTKHLDKFRKFNNPSTRILKFMDFSNVEDLFNIPSCVIIGEKGTKTIYPVDMEIYKEKLGEIILHKKESFNPKPNTSKRSFYYNKFKTGASIFPKSLYFVDIVDQKPNGKLNVTTSSKISSKQNWRDVVLKGVVDRKYLFLTLESLKMVPFGIMMFSDVILPLELRRHENRATLNIIENYYTQEHEWFIKANNEWISRRTPKSEKRFPSLVDRLDYNQLLKNQDLNSRYLVLYAGTGKNLCSAVIDREKVKLDNNNLEFINDVKNWAYETDSMDEAHYLCAILNSDYLNGLIKPLQPTGVGGPRAIHRKPLEFPIPKFDSEEMIHTKLSKISINCHLTIRTKLNSKLSRKQVRMLLKNEFAQINDYVSMIF